MNTRDDIHELLSCCIDGELKQHELEQLIKKLLENSTLGEQLRNEWKNLHLISTKPFADTGNQSDITLSQTNELPLIDVSAQISRQIEEQQQVYPVLTRSELIKPLITSIPGYFGFSKTLLVGSAIAASLVLVVVNTNLNNTETDSLLNQNSVTRTENIKAQQTPVLVTSRYTENNKQENIKVKLAREHLTEKNPVLVNNNSISAGILYKVNPPKNTNINYINRPVVNKKYSNLIHNVSLKKKYNSNDFE